VNTALAALFEFEVLDRVGHVDVPAIDPGGLERAIEQPSGRTDERPALQILLIARLFADQHQLRVRRPFTQHALCRLGVERTAAAFLHGAAELLEIAALRHERGCIHVMTSTSITFISKR
jgi:hypothetical protein